jgi:hypothetical protein
MKTKDRQILQSALALLNGPLSTTRDGLWDAHTASSLVQAMLGNIFYQDDQIMTMKLEHVGAGIVDTLGGLDEALKMLQIQERRN